MNLLTPHWEHPACVKCAHCLQPIELAWSSSAVGHDLYHGDCYKTHNNKKETS